MTTGFSNPLSAGSMIIQPVFQSPNFSVADQTGWAVYENGDAVFYSLTLDGGNVVISDSGGVFLYDGTPGTGNLLASLSNETVDPYGNFTVAVSGFVGLGLYNGTLAVGIFPQGLQVFTGSLSAGWTAAIASIGYDANGFAVFGPLELSSNDINVTGELQASDVTGALQFIPEDGNTYDT